MPPADDDVAADLGVRPQEQVHRLVHLRLLLGTVVHHHQVTLVAHHTADFQPAPARRAGEHARRPRDGTRSAAARR